MSENTIDELVTLLAKLPGLGPRSARRIVLHLINKRDSALEPLARGLYKIIETIKNCTTCGNLDTRDPCAICSDMRRDQSKICVVEDIVDLWALERSASYRGLYHILGGTLSALDGDCAENVKSILS